MEQGTDIKIFINNLKAENICKLIMTYKCSFLFGIKMCKNRHENDINSKNGCGWKW